MGFLSRPKVPKPVPPPNAASAPITAKTDSGELPNIPFGAGSLISTSSSGLKRKASTQRVSLIGG